MAGLDAFLDQKFDRLGLASTDAGTEHAAYRIESAPPIYPFNKVRGGQ